ncbi:MAG: AI-2E family transporter [Vicinamibacterales bacterium]
MADDLEPEIKPHASLPEVPTRITALQVIAGLLLLFAIGYGRGVLAPLMLALLGSLALAPPVRVLSRMLPRWLASAIVVIGITSAFGVTAYLLSDEVAAFSRRLPTIVRDVRAAVQSASPRQGLLRQLQQAVTELERTADSAAGSPATPVKIVEPVDIQRGMVVGARRLSGYLGQGIMMIFLVYFLLASGEMFKQKLVKISSRRLSQRKITLQMIEEINLKIGRFVFYQAWSGLLVGIATWLVFSWLGVRYAGLWGVAAGVLNTVPYAGPTFILVASALAALVQFKSPGMVALVAGSSVVITALEGFLLAPTMLGQAARVNSVSVFICIMFWGWLWGGIGLIVAVPVLMIVKTIADHVESLSGLRELLSD